MHFNMKSLLCCLLLSTLTLNGIGQDRQIDSIKSVISKAKEDTNKVNSLLLLSKKYFNEEPTEAIAIATRARDLADKIGFKKGEAYALKNIGIGYYMQGKYLETFDYWNQSMVYFDSVGDRQGVANILSNIGSVYFDQGDDANALENYLKSLKISEEIGDKLRIATALGNIGNVYLNKKATLDKALTFYLRALPISEEIGDQNIVGTTTVGIGEVYFKKQNYDSALFYFNKSLVAYKGSEAVPYSLNQIGRVNTKRKNYELAVKNHLQAYELGKNLDAKLDMIQSLLGLGVAYEASEEYNKAIVAYRESERLSLEIGSKGDELKETYQGLASSFATLKDYSNAF